MKLKRKFEKRDLLNIVVILMLIGLFAWVSVEYTKTFGNVKGDDLISSAQNLQQFILSYGNAGLFIIVFMHVLQVVVAFIPSVAVQFVGGMIYGMPIGMITGIIGISIGTTISFYLSRLLGRRILTLFISEKNIATMEKLLSGDMSTLVLLALFILPTPKDFIAYFVGLTNMKAYKFFLISAVGRLPGMIIATYLGAHIFDKNYALIISVAVGASLLFVLLYIFKDKILRLTNRRTVK